MRTSMLSRWSQLVLWTVVTCVIAGVYGLLHDQVTYTISPDYFHLFKFRQFRISPGLSPRVGASIVGWMATWWLGLLIAPAFVVTLLRGLGTVPIRAYLRCVAVVLFVAATFFLLGWLVGLAVIRTDDPGLWSPEGSQDPVAFQRVGLIHEASYLGGAVGWFAGWFWARREVRQHSVRVAT